MIRADLLRKMAVEHLKAYAKDEQGRADYLQSLAVRAQRNAHRARKELRRREMEAKAGRTNGHGEKNE